jgi:putative transposase
MARRKDPLIPDALLDQLLSGSEASAAFDQGGLLDQLKKGKRRFGTLLAAA